MKTHTLQESLDKLHFLFQNGWDVEALRSRNANEPQMLIQVPVSDLIAVAVEVALATCQTLIDNQDKLSNRSLLNRSEAAEYLGCTRQTLRNYENLAIVIPSYINGQPYYRQEDLDNINECKRGVFKNDGNKDVRTAKGKKKGGKSHDF